MTQQLQVVFSGFLPCLAVMVDIVPYTVQELHVVFKQSVHFMLSFVNCVFVNTMKPL